MTVITPEVVKLINSLTEKINQVAPQVWATLMKQAYITGIQSIIGSIVCGVVTLVGIIFLVDGIGHFANPHYYAIKLLLNK